jgi:hypothetical protein
MLDGDEDLYILKHEALAIGVLTLIHDGAVVITDRYIGFLIP